MTDVSNTIELAPWVAALQPIAVAAGTTLASGLAIWGLSLFQKWTGLKIDQDNQAKFANAISTQAGLAIAASATNLAGESINAHSPAVKVGADYIAANLGHLLEATGQTPDNVAHEIAAAIGNK